MDSFRAVSLSLRLVLFCLACASCGRPGLIQDQAPTSGSKDGAGQVLAGAISTPTRRSATGEIARGVLTFEDLMNGFLTGSPVPEESLTPPSDHPPSLHQFEGRLELRGEAEEGGFQLLRGNPQVYPEEKHIPEFDFEFVQLQDDLIPVKRGLIVTDHPYWNYILEPGRVWRESGDQGFSRASFPFALVWKGSNATLNGVMTFLFNDEQVSKVWYQITQETTIGYSADFWGLLDADYNPGPVDEAESIRLAFAQELADRFPTRPIEQLAEDYPGVDASAFGQGVSPRNLTWYGFVVDGINYVSGCPTRYGEYPYCETMRVPSYSTAKSAFVSVVLMRLALKYDPAVDNLLVKDFVPEAAESPGDWSEVTFDNSLDMATGNYVSSQPMVDEEQWETDPFWSEEYYAGRIAAAFDWKNSADPGSQWVYRTSDTFILTRALQNYLNSQQGPEADIFEFVVEEVYQPLHIGPGAFTTLRTKDDDWNGLPYGGYGMWWIPDDLAKISSFLNADGGAIEDEQILHSGMLAAALQRDPSDRGVERHPGGRYNNAFWADRYGASQGFDCEFWVSEMLGYSGIVVVLIPNGTSYYYASDGREFTWDSAVIESNAIRPICP